MSNAQAYSGKALKLLNAAKLAEMLMAMSLASGLARGECIAAAERHVDLLRQLERQETANLRVQMSGGNAAAKGWRDWTPHDDVYWGPQGRPKTERDG